MESTGTSLWLVMSLHSVKKNRTIYLEKVFVNTTAIPTYHFQVIKWYSNIFFYWSWILVTFKDMSLYKIARWNHTVVLPFDHLSISQCFQFSIFSLCILFLSHLRTCNCVILVLMCISSSGLSQRGSLMRQLYTSCEIVCCLLFFRFTSVHSEPDDMWFPKDWYLSRLSKLSWLDIHDTQFNSKTSKTIIPLESNHIYMGN